MWFKRKPKEVEHRASLESPGTPLTAETFADFFNMSGGLTEAGRNVTVEKALKIPAMWAGVNFISSTIASLPLNLYEKTEDGRKRVNNSLSSIIKKAVTEEQTSFDWRKYSMERTLTGGRSVSFIERSASGLVLNIWQLEPSRVTVVRKNGRKTYKYKASTGVTFSYSASEVIDIPFMLGEDGLTAISPVMNCADALGLAIAATNYGAKFFEDGGVPPFVMTGPFKSGAALGRAADDLQSTISKSSKERRLALTLPTGHEIKTLGVDPEKSQLVELKRFCIEEVARILSLPPVFIQDLMRATFNNTEQQDLHLVKHTISRWVKQWEQELNLKLFGRGDSKYYVEFNLDGLLRGDFKTRLEGYAKGIQNAVYTPNECRKMENMPDDQKGDHLLIQGATVPLGSQPINQGKNGAVNEN